MNRRFLFGGVVGSGGVMAVRADTGSVRSGGEGGMVEVDRERHEFANKDLSAPSICQANLTIPSVTKPRAAHSYLM